MLRFFFFLMVAKGASRKIIYTNYLVLYNMFRDPFAPKKRKRVRPTKSEKNQIWDKQDGNCDKCGKRLSPTTSEYHHKNGNPANWRLSNLSLVCVECHKKERNKQRVKKVQKRRREKEREEDVGLFSGPSLLEPAPKKRRKKSDNPFDFGF